MEDVVEQVHFFRQTGAGGWAWSAARTATLAYLDAKGVAGLPVLADAMLAMLEPGVKTPHLAVAALYAARRPSERLPPYARLSTRWD